MRWIFFSLLIGCATSSAQTAPVASSEVPAHTQAMIDAYRQLQAAKPQARPAQALCASEDRPEQLRAKYEQIVGRCEEPAEEGDSMRDVVPRAQWPALYAAINLSGVERCLREGYTFFDLQGTFNARIELAADGAIEAVRSRGDDAVGCCVRRELRKAHFPAPGRTVALEIERPLDEDARVETYSGLLTKDEIRAVIAKHEGELGACYTNQRAPGRLTVRFVIAPSGEVARAVIEEDGLGAPVAACCLIEKVRSWRFPAPQRGGSVHVTYPFDIRL